MYIFYFSNYPPKIVDFVFILEYNLFTLISRGDKMVYISQIKFGEHSEKSRTYPENVLAPLKIQSIFLKDITILYGSNGSGKSTVLNLIATKLRCNNSREHYGVCYDKVSDTIINPFEKVAERLSVEWARNENGIEIKPTIPPKNIASNDVFSHILGKERQNQDINKEIEYDNIIVNNWQWEEDEGNRLLKIAKKLEDFSQLNRETLCSNGEEAYLYYDGQIENDGIYLLDEPEASLSPVLQKKLSTLIYEASRYCGAQFIIATHSPFFLSLHGAKIINLDNKPATDFENWYELKNMKPYFELFGKPN